MRVYILLLALLISGCANLTPSNKKSFSFHEADLDHLRTTISNGTSCESIIQGYLKRIKSYDQPNQINSIILINPNALNKARQLDSKYASGKKLKSLHCAPVILKDNFDTADMPTEAGSIALKGSIPPDDAFMVKKLRAADAIIIAKSNMGEWAFSPYETFSTTHGATRNAYDVTRVPAGSSGGTASAIAANFGIIGMGTDTGNSIRGPASHLSLVGIRSTIGMTSRDGVVPLLLNRDIAGPLTRTVKDAAITFDIIGGYDAADKSTLAAKSKFKGNYVAYLKMNGLEGARIGVLRQMIDDTSDPEIMSLFNQAIKDLTASGATVLDNIVVQDFEKLSKATGFCSRFKYDIDNYFASLGDNAPVKNLAEVIEKNLFDERNKGAMKWATSVEVAPEDQNPPCVDVKGDPRRSQFLEAILSRMSSDNLDALIYPSWTNPPRKIGDFTSAHGNKSPVIAPHTGQPAITIPMGFTSEGLPAGLQILGKPFDEHLLFQYAYAYEQKTKHRKAPNF